MRVTEEQLAEVLAQNEPARNSGGPADPVAALLVEAMATIYPAHCEEVREVGHFLCALIGSAEGHGAGLDASVAMHAFVRDEHVPPDRMWSHLAATAERNVLLGLSAQAVLRGVRRQGPRSETEHRAILHTLFLLIRAFEAHEETAALEQALQADAVEPADRGEHLR